MSFFFFLYITDGHILATNCVWLHGLILLGYNFLLFGLRRFPSPGNTGSCSGCFVSWSVWETMCNSYNRALGDITPDANSYRSPVKKRMAKIPSSLSLPRRYSCSESPFCCSKNLSQMAMANLITECNWIEQRTSPSLNLQHFVTTASKYTAFLGTVCVCIINGRGERILHRERLLAPGAFRTLLWAYSPDLSLSAKWETKTRKEKSHLQHT